MAYDAGILNEQQQQANTGMGVLGPQSTSAQQAQSVPAPAPPPGAGGSSTIQDDSSSGSKRTKTGTPRSGTFTNIQQYLQANRQSAPNIASAVSEDLTGRASELGQAITQKQNEYQQKVQQAQQQQQELTQQAQQTVQQAAQTGQLDPNRLAEFRNIYTGQTKAQAPGDINLAPETMQAERLVSQAQQGKTPQGRFQLLRQTFGEGPRRYTRGEQSLDNLLLQSTPEGREALGQKLDTAATSTQDMVDTARRQALEARSGLQSAYDTSRQQLEQILTQTQAQQRAELEAEAARREDTRRRLQESLGQGKVQLSPEDYAALGLDYFNIVAAQPGLFTPAFGVAPQFTESEGQMIGNETFGMFAPEVLGNINAAQYLRDVPTYTAQNVATPEQAARLNALAQLAGRSDDVVGTGSPTNYYEQLVDTNALNEALRNAVKSYYQSYNQNFIDEDSLLDMIMPDILANTNWGSGAF